MAERGRIASLVAREMAGIRDDARRSALTALLVEPRREEREWEYGEPGLHFPCWVVAEDAARHVVLAYCEHGFGPERP